MTNKQVNFLNTIDEKEEILDDAEGWLNVVLYLTDDKYEELINRTVFLSDKGITFEKALNETDATFSAYAGFHPNGAVEVNIYMESDDLGWTDAEVPLTEDEKKVLREDLDRVAKYRGTTVQKLFDEALNI